MDIYVARQPIFTGKKKVFAYELLFRDSMNNYMPDIDGDSATSSVLSNSFMSMGLDVLSGGKKVFINFTENLLLKLIPSIFPSDLTVVEILETVSPEEAVLQACLILKKKGYTLALDDFIFEPGMTPLLEIADIVKVDFMGVDLDTLREKVKGLPGNLKLLAEKVETWDEFRAGIDMGFELFQGYFFCKPEIVKGKELPASSVALLEIMSEVINPELDFDSVTSQISRDVSISYKLMKYINSAFFKRVQEIKSIKNALVYLGQNELRRFISVVLMSSLASSGTAELAISSCIRARFCELAGSMAGRAGDAQELFTLGLFSLIDAILDKPMGEIMEKLPLSDRINSALVQNEGPFADFLSLAVAFEKGDWESVIEQSGNIGLETEALPDIYSQAVEWADTLKGI